MRLTRLWQRGKNHSWIFVAINVAQERDALIEQLNRLAAGGIVSMQPGQTALNLVHALTKANTFERLHVIQQPGCTWHATWWQDANTLRERMADAFAKPVVFWLASDAVDAAARHAPDFWNWRETLIDLNRRVSPAMPTFNSHAFDHKGVGDKIAVEQRLSELDAYFLAQSNQNENDATSSGFRFLHS